CHLPDGANNQNETTEKPHNVFGTRLVQVRGELRKAGKSTDIIERLYAIADEDADGDGGPNLLEIFAGHLPGDPNDRATAAELETARAALAAFRSKKQDYAWKPFEKVQRPALPDVTDAAWAKHPIDRFLAVEHAKHGLKPRPEAPPHVLLRRLYLDMIGLPPSPEETTEFAAAWEAAATTEVRDAVWSKAVERVLASPHYGERWGRHWMDVWRYSDWAGYGNEVRDSQPHIWRWRDWIIESLNADKPYDQMIVEMLAGDEAAPTDPKVLRATGFLVRNWYKFNRDVWLDRIVEHTAKGFLGVTLNCARCHDHFFDPITQKEYYQFRAFFEPHDIRTDRVPGSPDISKDGLVRVYDAKLAAPTYLYVRGDDKNPDKKNPLLPAVPAALGGSPLSITAVTLPRDAVRPERQQWLIDETVHAHETAVKDAENALAKVKAPAPGAQVDAAAVEEAGLMLDLARAKLAALHAVLAVEQLEETTAKGPEWEQAAQEAVRRQREVKVLEAKKNLVTARRAAAGADAKSQAALQKKVDEAALALKKIEEEAAKPLNTAYTKRIVSNYPGTSTGRRLALAKWIADEANPLTARVAVNHIWLRHFGKPLAPNPFDFGANAKPPSHPALLDWLAAEFMNPHDSAAGAEKPPRWSMKRLHRLILTSRAYRMDSTNDAGNAAKDPDNVYLWRMNARRMEAEIVRDSVLAVAGQLDRTMGGPEIPEQQGLTTRRRSIYYRYAPEKMMEFLTLFDSANVTECYQRTESIVPQQALAMSNSSLVLAQSRLLARQLMKHLGGVASAENAAAFTRTAFVHILGRAPNQEEQSACEAFLAQQATLLANPKGLTVFSGGTANAIAPAADPQLRARESLVHVLLNHHEFVTIR
ncbi:MAG: DUF1553 domain-containing protein, partial [Gemmataceae bacterium]|nr:DUF1553 domain-containing protein [Gemmataceae bacterium]